ncbi:Rpr2-domain-containing protein [Mytilinidion resinicola]|uniref:Rpr2-domain-containing protein n=1 Tax=Mytilinidion resinicola TaxID=574789 RepID=A0A6A6YMR6_9PEZI|nr:Rpr2-domain-containing protein [Mytilinidion resinicola]KAF2810031.1 Rpr2-domain-containing protein [Mytilinidion resinicola]
MAKAKEPKGRKSIPNKHIHARVSYLYQAASYLSLQTPDSGQHKEIKEGIQPRGDTPNATASSTKIFYESETDHEGQTQHATRKSPQSGLALFLVSQLRSISQKSQVRLSHDLKRSLCKSCNALLVPGRNSTTSIENASRNGKKPWADILVIECQTCGSKKRFPVGSKRQARKSGRLNVMSSTRNPDEAMPVDGA